MKHVYLAIENVGLNDTQRDTLIDELKRIGPKWSSEEMHGFTPIVYEYDQEGEIISQTGGEPITWTRYFHKGMPAHFNHWRVRLDKQAIILEAMFKDSALTVDTFKNRLATIFSVDPSTIDSVTQLTQWGPLVTFSRSGDRLRFLLFGGINATWQESGDACRAFLSVNKADWETEL